MSTVANPPFGASVRPRWKVTVTGDRRTQPGGEGVRTDPELVAACIASQPGAFEELVERHQRKVYQLCYRFVGNHEDASDLAQEIFLRVHRGLHRFRGNAALSTWVYRIGVNVCLNHVGVKRPRLEALDPVRERASAAPTQLDRVERGERAVAVRAAIAKLPDRQRATLILRVYHDLTHREIAQILGSSVGSVKANFFHALRNMRRHLETQGR